MAIPTGFIGGLEDEIFPHFGKAPTFTLVDIKNNLIYSTEIIKNSGEHFGGNLTPSDILIEKNIKAKFPVRGGMGGRVSGIAGPCAGDRALHGGPGPGADHDEL